APPPPPGGATRLAPYLAAPPAGKPPGRRAAGVLGDDGAPTATPVGGPGSHLVHALARSNALLVLPAGSAAPRAGEMIDTLIYGAQI
ncbi:MAG: hypothetical protein L0I99_01530, partial [Micrococcaceae bacterium]|nr:hypothetical protein [Micrococcaceae bacterium]